MNLLETPEGLLESLTDIAQRAGAEIMKVYAQAEIETEYKGDASPLTAADLASHKLIVSELTALTPDIPVLSEESKSIPYSERSGWTRFWLVDPLDGTKEFIKRNGEFTVNIALIDAGAPVIGVVHAPVLDVTYYATKGTGAYKLENGNRQEIRVQPEVTGALKVVASRSHAGAETDAYLERLRATHALEVVSIGSSLKLCLVAEGAAHLYPRFGPTMEWDTAAAQGVVEAAGGTVTDLEGAPLRYNKETLLNPYFIVRAGADIG